MDTRVYEKHLPKMAKGTVLEELRMFAGGFGYELTSPNERSSVSYRVSFRVKGMQTSLPDGTRLLNASLIRLFIMEARDTMYVQIACSNKEFDRYATQLEREAIEQEKSYYEVPHSAYEVAQSMGAFFDRWLDGATFESQSLGDRNVVGWSQLDGKGQDEQREGNSAETVNSEQLNMERRENLFCQIESEQKLLADYESQLQTEDDPRRIRKIEKEIARQKTNIQDYGQQYRKDSSNE